MRSHVWLALSITLMASAADGQVPRLSFDVASVKPHNPKVPPSVSGCQNGRLRASIPIYYLVTIAYNLRFPQTEELEEQLPAWAKTADGSYDVEGIAETAVSVAQCWLMARSLLEDRFKLAWHWEMKEGSFYELAIAPGGHKMQKVADADTGRGYYVTVNGNLTQPPPLAPVLRGLTMAEFANFISLSTPDRRGVVDETGLEGLFKISLAFSTDPLQYSDPDLGTALQKQMGLKLERRKGLVEHFVLDHIQRPDPN